jgi:DNA polymerase-3 subunit gamma/tau
MGEERLALARKYRPATFADVVGQKPVAALLYQMARRGTVPDALLLHGRKGCGKTSTARILGAALNCAEPPGPAASWPCGTCPSCKAVAAGISPDVEEVDAASNGGVENVRAIRERALYGTGGNYKLFLVDEAHAMSDSAFEALLKIIEEPPPRTIFVLLTTRPGSIPGTVSSRCSPFAFRPISVPAITGRLAYIAGAEGLDMEPELLAALAEAAGGSMRDAVMKLDQLASVGITSLAMWQELTGETDFAPALLAMAADGYHEGMFRLLDEVTGTTGDYPWITSQVAGCLRDMLVLGEGGEVAVQGRALEARADLAARLGPARVVSALRVLWDLQVKVRMEDKASALSLAMVMVSEKLCPRTLADNVPAPRLNGHAGASIGQLQKILGVAT